jgi:hypothetical protein
MLEAVIGWCAHCWARWGGMGREILYFGGSRVQYTHLGCFGARGGSGGGGRAYIRCQTNQNPSQLGRQCLLDLLRLGFAPGLVALGFSYIKKHTVVYTAYLHTIYCFINVWAHEHQEKHFCSRAP